MIILGKSFAATSRGASRLICIRISSAVLLPTTLDSAQKYAGQYTDAARLYALGER